MKRFAFRLASVLRLRQQVREQAQLALAEALRQRETISGKAMETNGELKELEQHMRSAAKRQNVDVDRLLDGHRHRSTLQARLAELAEAMREADEQVERCRQKLIEADREVKVLEKLHEKQVAEHRAAAAREEIKQNDETAARRAKSARSRPLPTGERGA